MSAGPEEASKGPAEHRDFLPLAAQSRGKVDPVPWTRLSRADCMLLAIALHRCTRVGREAALDASAQELFATNPVP
jgi:hypothetical protein